MILKNGKRIDSGCSDTVPIGTLNPYVGTVAPFGYLICQGQRESKITYPELAAICGDLFGPSTSTEFYLPDLRGQTIAGYKEGDSVFGTLGGLIGSITKSYTPAGTNTGGAVQSHTLTGDESGIAQNIYAHVGVHSTSGSAESITLSGQSSGYGGLQINRNIANADGALSAKKANAKNGHTHGFTQPTFTGTQADINVVQPTVALNWIVKAFALMPNVSTVVTTTNSSDSNVYSTNYINQLFETMKRDSFDFAHPVGSYYETSDSTWTPQAAGWYGTWVADNDGSALVSYKSSGAFNKATGTIVGGESQSYTPAGTNKNGAVKSHTLTAAESGLPKHSHTLNKNVPYGIPYNDTGGTAVGNGGGVFYHESYSPFSIADAGPSNASSGHSHDFTQPTFTGTAATLSTIQTSKVIYRWHRTA